jgi:hypothetical protein
MEGFTGGTTRVYEVELQLDRLPVGSFIKSVTATPGPSLFWVLQFLGIDSTNNLDIHYSTVKSFVMPSTTPSVTSSKDSTTVVTDLTISFESTTSSTYYNSTLEKDWYRIEKALYLHALAEQSAWQHVARVKEEELTSSHFVVTDVRVGEPPSATDVKDGWESRPAGLWLRRSNYTSNIQHVVTGIDVFFGVDAIDPRLQWSLLREPFQLKDAPPEIPIARPTIRRGQPKPSPEKLALRAREDGSFKIVQISDTHMMTGVGSCKDAIDAD